MTIKNIIPLIILFGGTLIFLIACALVLAALK